MVPLYYYYLYNVYIEHVYIVHCTLHLQWPFIFFPVADRCINEYQRSVNFPPTEKTDFKKYLIVNGSNADI